MLSACRSCCSLTPPPIISLIEAVHVSLRTQKQKRPTSIHGPPAICEEQRWLLRICIRPPHVRVNENSQFSFLEQNKFHHVVEGTQHASRVVGDGDIHTIISLFRRCCHWSHLHRVSLPLPAVPTPLVSHVHVPTPPLPAGWPAPARENKSYPTRFLTSDDVTLARRPLLFAPVPVPAFIPPIRSGSHMPAKLCKLLRTLALTLELLPDMRPNARPVKESMRLGDLAESSSRRIQQFGPVSRQRDWGGGRGRGVGGE